MPRSPSAAAQSAPLRTTVSFSDPAFAAFRDFAASAYPGLPISTALREAVLIAMGTDPLEAARVAARRAAYLSARSRIMALLATSLRTGANAIDLDVAESTAELHAMEIGA